MGPSWVGSSSVSSLCSPYSHYRNCWQEWWSGKAQKMLVQGQQKPSCNWSDSSIIGYVINSKPIIIQQNKIQDRTPCLTPHPLSAFYQAGNLTLWGRYYLGDFILHGGLTIILWKQWIPMEDEGRRSPIVSLLLFCPKLNFIYRLWVMDGKWGGAISVILLAMFASIYPQPTILSGSSPKPAVKFPEDVQVILRADRPSAGNLFIGNVEAAENKTILESLRITALLCVAKGYGTKHSSSVVKHNKYIPIEDEEEADLSPHLPVGVAFIAEKLKITNVLVHCVAGTNRSAVFVMAFLMKHMGLTLEDAYLQVKSRRKVINPSEHMVAQLKNYESNLGLNHPIVQSSPPPSIRLNQASTFIDPQERSVRIKTAQNNANTSNIHSNFLEVGDTRSNRGSKAASKMRTDEIDERRSQRPSSCHSRPNIEISHPKGRNPEESFISRNSKPPSALDKSFCAPSQVSRSLMGKDLSVANRSMFKDQVIETVSRGDREEFLEKLQRTESRNREINQRIEAVQERFDHTAHSSRLQMQSQLHELEQVRSHLHSQHSERKGKIMERRNLHDQSMDNRQAQQYIASFETSTLPLQTAVKRRL